MDKVRLMKGNQKTANEILKVINRGAGRSAAPLSIDAVRRFLRDLFASHAFCTISRGADGLVWLTRLKNNPTQPMTTATIDGDGDDNGQRRRRTVTIDDDGERRRRRRTTTTADDDDDDDFLALTDARACADLSARLFSLVFRLNIHPSRVLGLPVRAIKTRVDKKLGSSSPF